uniref:Uncharacterized protein n=1 Tax=Ciona savignyi TaxID=51511 RepID=H2ZBI5_CIOSA
LFPSIFLFYCYLKNFSNSVDYNKRTRYAVTKGMAGALVLNS